MYEIFAGLVVLIAVVWFAVPALARTAGPTTAVTIAASDTSDSTKGDVNLKLDKWDPAFLKGTVFFKESSDLTKGRVANLKCDLVQVDVVAKMPNGDMMLDVPAATGPDRTTCVYSMKVPANVPLTVRAVVPSDGVTLHVPSKSETLKPVVGWDLATSKTVTGSPASLSAQQKAGGYNIKLTDYKGGAQLIKGEQKDQLKLKTGEGATLPLYVDLSTLE